MTEMEINCIIDELRERLANKPPYETLYGQKRFWQEKKC